MCASKQFCAVLHVLWCLVYIGAGTVQMVAGVFFLITLPIFKTGSNIWVGAWNILVGISCTIVSCVGDLTPKKQETLLYCTFSILAVNVVNLVILEVGEWNFFMSDSVAAIIGQKNFKKLVYFAHMTTSLSTAVAIISAFLDSQFTFCSMQRAPKRKPVHEAVSDIEYIIPRTKTRSVGKQAQNIYNQYAQSWVFDAETPTSSKTESPYLKLPTLTQYDGNKTITIRTHTTNHLDIDQLQFSPDLTSKKLLVKPTVHVDPGSDDSNGGRSLNHMKSFSRTPSPVNHSDSSSLDSSMNPPIYECLERLTEPAIYRTRLNTAISLTADETLQTFGTRNRLFSAHTSPMHMEGPLVRPRSEIITGNRLCVVECASDVTEKVQYASLVAELQQSFKSNKDKFHHTFSPETASGSDKTQSASKNSESDSQKTEPKGSDTEFSKELEAALQLIQDLESPNTAETPSDGGVNKRVVSVKWRDSDASDASTKTLSESVSPSDFPDDDVTVVADNGKRTSVVMLAPSGSCSRSSSGYSSPRRQTPIESNSGCSSSSSSTLIMTSQMQIACMIHNRGNSAIISLYSPASDNRTEGRRASTQFTEHNTLETRNRANKADSERSPHAVVIECCGDDKSEKDVPKRGSVGPEIVPRLQNVTRRWSMMARLGKKAPAPPKMAPELEGAIFKPESLAYLTDLELIARHEKSKSIQREIEQRIHQQISGTPDCESHC